MCRALRCAFSYLSLTALPGKDSRGQFTVGKRQWGAGEAARPSLGPELHHHSRLPRGLSTSRRERRPAQAACALTAFGE